MAPRKFIRPASLRPLLPRPPLAERDANLQTPTVQTAEELNVKSIDLSLSTLPDTLESPVPKKPRLATAVRVPAEAAIVSDDGDNVESNIGDDIEKSALPAEDANFEDGDWIFEDDGEDEDNDVDDEGFAPVIPETDEKPDKKAQWMAKWSLKNNDMKLSQDQIEEHLARFRGRFEHVLKTMIQGAKGLSYGDVCNAAGLSRPMTVGSWTLLTRLDWTQAIELYLQHIPEIVQVVLGRPKRPDPADIDDLPNDWRGNDLHGVYGDFTQKEGEDFFDPYVGSATNKGRGLHERLVRYYRIEQNVKTRKGQLIKPHNRHERRIADPKVKTNLRILFVMARDDQMMPYISLGEQLWASFFGCHNNARTGHAYATRSAKTLGDAAIPTDFLPIPWDGLNDAFQMLQGLRTVRELVCVNCQKTNSKRWYSAHRGLPFGKRICVQCYDHRYRNNGEERPLWKIVRERTKPADGICGNGICADKIVSFNKDHMIWLCDLCDNHTRRHGNMRDEARILRSLELRGRRKLPKPADGICQNGDCQSKPSSGHWRWFPEEMKWICKHCRDRQQAAQRAKKRQAKLSDES